MAAAWNDVPATGGLSECAALVRSAEALRTSAPELSVQLARRALVVGTTEVSASNTHAGEARTLSMRAQAVLTAGLVRTSQHVGAVEPGFAALGLAESGGALVLAAELRLDLAACAQEVGEPLLGGALLRPVLEATYAPPSVRAAALGRLVGCVAHVARRDDIEDALSEADRLLAADDSLAPDARRIERARLSVRSAAYHRWYGDNEDAVTAARDGLTLLNRLRRERRPESDRLHARLVLELVCALLDEGELHEAETAARPTVDEPVRATSAESVGQVMLALATRVHLPAGEVERGRGLVDQAAWLAERHSLDSMLADALTEVSRLDEQEGRAKEALEAMRAARAAEQRRMRAVGRAARHLLLQVTASQGVRDASQQAVASLLRQLAHPSGVPVAVAPSVPSRTALPPMATQEPVTPPITGELVGADEGDARERTNLVEQPTGLLNREGLVSRLRSVRTGERPVALTLVRFEPYRDNPEEDRGPDTGIMVGLADKVRDIAPENAELARSDGGELAVLLPHTTRDEAEEFAATIRETATRSGWAADGTGKDMSISTSVVQSDPQAPDDDPHVDADTMLAAARSALLPANAAPTSATPTEPPAPGPDPAADVSLAETKSALSALTPSPPLPPPLPPPQQPPAQQEQVPPPPAEPPSTVGAEPATPATAEAATPARAEVATPAGVERATPAGALTDDPPTTPLNVAQQPGAATAGRSILNTLSIPSGSGGRRRADGEQAPGTKTTRPTEPAEAPRLTRAERRAHQQAATTDEPSGHESQETAKPAEVSSAVETGWPAEPDVSQALYRTKPARPRDEATAQASSYEETRAELARMMSTLNAKALRARSKPEDKTSDAPGTSEPRTGTPAEIPDAATAHRSVDTTLPAPRQSIPTPPDPDEMPDPIPPAAPDPTPTFPDEPEHPRSGLLAAFDALTGPVPSTPSTDDKPTFRTDFDGAAGLPSRKPLTSWTALESASTVDSPADDLFGVTPTEPKSESRFSLGAAFNASSPSSTDTPRRALPGTPSDPPAETPQPEPPAERHASPTDAAALELPAAPVERHAAPTGAVPREPLAEAWPLPAEPAAPRGAAAGSPEPATSQPSSGAVEAGPARGPSTSAELRAALWDRLTTLAPAETARRNAPAEPAPGSENPPNQAETPRTTTAATEASATVGERSASEPTSGADEAAKEPASNGTVRPSGDGPAPSGASAAATYDEPIGPKPKPHGLPRRGERSATTIASLLTEALAAYQSGADDQQQPAATPERSDSLVGESAASAGRHRSPE